MCERAVEVCSYVVGVRGNSEGAITFGLDGCGVTFAGFGNTALVCNLAPTSLEESMCSSYSVLEYSGLFLGTLTSSG